MYFNRHLKNYYNNTYICLPVSMGILPPIPSVESHVKERSIFIQQNDGLKHEATLKQV